MAERARVPRAEFVRDLIAQLGEGTVPFRSSDAPTRTAYRIRCGDAPMNCHTCPAMTTGRATLVDGVPVVRCPECLVRLGFERG